MNIQKVHSKFLSYWPEYERRDLLDVCTSIIKLMGRKVKQPINQVRNDWSGVCNFLIQWEGNTK